MQYSDIIECFEPPVNVDQQKDVKVIERGRKIPMEPPVTTPKKISMPSKKKEKPESTKDYPPPPEKHKGTKEKNYYYRIK